jgi:hypothetical protein
MEKAYHYLKGIGADGQTTFKNAARLVESAALLIVAYYNFTSARASHLGSFEYKVRIAASLVIGLRGAYEFLRYLANKEVK